MVEWIHRANSVSPRFKLIGSLGIYVEQFNAL